MEKYVNEIRRIVSTGYSVSVTDASYTGNMPSSAIVIIPELFDSCPSISELTNLLNKRLKNIGVSRSGFTQTAIAIASLCSEGYSVSHKSIEGITSREMRNIWGILETAKVSSSPKLSSWLIKTTKERGEAGYARAYSEPSVSDEHNMTLETKKRYVRDTQGTREPVSLLFSERCFGIANTTRDAMIADMKMLCAIRFLKNEPVPTFRPDEGSRE